MCYNWVNMSERQKQVAKETMTTHGMSFSPEYEAWKRLKQRCFNKKNPSYKNYGGRGISVSDKWINSFECFFNDMGKRPSRKHTLDRVNNSQGYSKENCRWTTRDQQNRNHRGNRYYSYQGKNMCLMDWSILTGINYNTLKARLSLLDWSFEQAVEKPVAHKYRGNL